MRNEPNLKNTKINITAVPRKAYMENDVFTPTQNEPNFKLSAGVKPIYEKYAKRTQFLKHLN